MKWLPLVVLLSWFTLARDAAATWSVIAIDRDTGTVVVASATCVAQSRFANFPADGLMDIQAIVVPGKGAAAAQANVDRTRANQSLIQEALRSGTAPNRILDELRQDPAIETRQFGVVDSEGRSMGFSGTENSPSSLDAHGRVSKTEIVYSIQGNILANDDVVKEAVSAFKSATGTLTDRVMAAMEAADAEGGDRRCSCSSEPTTAAPCETKTSHVAYLLEVAREASREEPTLYINVTDENITAQENANPVATLRMRYDAARPSP